jgi:protein-L-isoaspartate(D-aspartate) O-methyltransferase
MHGLDEQRINMVESQVRPSDVTDRRIMRSMQAIARHDFVPPALRSLAYMDTDIAFSPATHARRYMLAPRTLAKLVQLASIEPTDVVLDVGCATGYSAALLSRLGQKVVALECDRELAETATRTLLTGAFGNVAVVQGDLATGYAQEGPYDAIVVEGAIAETPHALLGQLKDNGRLAAIVGQGAAGRAVVWRRIGANFGETFGFNAAAPVLSGFEPAPFFTF